MFRTSLLLLISLLLGACQTTSSYKEFASIKIWTPDFKVTRVINDPEDLRYIESVWNSLKQMESFPLSQESGDFDWYKLDVVFSSEHRGGRWLYDKKGYLMYLTYTAKPKYVITEVDKFNEALGL